MIVSKIHEGLSEALTRTHDALSPEVERRSILCDMAIHGMIAATTASIPPESTHLPCILIRMLPAAALMLGKSLLVPRKLAHL